MLREYVCERYMMLLRFESHFVWRKRVNKKSVPTSGIKYNLERR
jgi:hypothetical protein